MDQLLILLGLAFLGSVAGLIGGILFLVNKRLANWLSSYAIPLAAGVLLATSFLDLLPHAIEEIGVQPALTIVLVLFVSIFILEHFFVHLHHHNHAQSEHEHKGKHLSVPMVLLGDTVHNLLDGAAIAAAFIVSPNLGFMAAFATFLHETPHEIADFGILISHKWSGRNALIANFLSSLSTFAGAILTWMYADSIESFAGILLSASAALFLYISTTDFLPEAIGEKSEKRKRSFVVFIIGILIIFVMGMLVPDIGH